MYVLFKSSAGIDPVKSFPLKFRKSNFESFPNSLGIVPLNELPSIEQDICAEDIIYRLEKQSDKTSAQRENGNRPTCKGTHTKHASAYTQSI